MTVVPIMFSFNRDMLMPAVVCLTSLLENAAEDTYYDIFILHRPGCELGGSALDKLPELYPNCRITLREAGTSFKDAYQIRGITIETYFRLLASELIPEYDKLLYSDVDVIFREDLQRFYNLDLGDYYYGAVDNGAPMRPDVQEYLKTIAFDGTNGYFYAGNLVINSALLRKDNMTARFMELGKNNYPQQDMDIMNIACKGRIMPVDVSYCLTVQLYDLAATNRPEMEAYYGKEQLENALRQGIIHYNGVKPWNHCCPNMDIWWLYYRKSHIFDESFCNSFWQDKRDALEKLPLLKRFKILLRYGIDRKKWKNL